MPESYGIVKRELWNLEALDSKIVERNGNTN